MTCSNLLSATDTGQKQHLDGPIHLGLVTPEIPANTGNIMRLAASTGIPLHLVEPLGFTLDHRELSRAAMDYRKNCVLRRHLTFEDLEKEYPCARFLFLSARARCSFFDFRVQVGDFLVLGPESTGLTDRFLAKRERAKNTYCLPMPGSGRSLNLATAAGIAVYEALRQLNSLSHATREEPRCPP